MCHDGVGGKSWESGQKAPRVLRVGQQKQEEVGRPTSCWACCPSSSLKPCSLLPSRALECVSRPPVRSTRGTVSPLESGLWSLGALGKQGQLGPQPAGDTVHAVFTRVLVCAEGLFTPETRASSHPPVALHVLPLNRACAGTRLQPPALLALFFPWALHPVGNSRLVFAEQLVVLEACS